MKIQIQTYKAQPDTVALVCNEISPEEKQRVANDLKKLSELYKILGHDNVQKVHAFFMENPEFMTKIFPMLTNADGSPNVNALKMFGA